MIKAVIFDMDGVISDTLPIHSEAESKVFLKYGIRISPQEILREFNAVPDRVMFKTIFERSNKKLDIEQVEEEKWRLFQELAKDNIPTIPGSIELINLLAASSFILGVASSAPSRIIDLVLEALGIKKKFKAIVCTEKVKQGKPAPDIFLLAAEKLQVNSRDCVVIEDAARGIQAAKAAGMKCIGITTTHSREELEGADKIIDNFSELSLEEIQSL